jgi:hypothetical protein
MREADAQVCQSVMQWQLRHIMMNEIHESINRHIHTAKPTSAKESLPFERSEIRHSQYHSDVTNCDTPLEAHKHKLYHTTEQVEEDIKTEISGRIS